MLAPVLVFLVVSGVIVGAYLAATSLPAWMARRRVDQRLKDVASPIQERPQADTASVVTRQNEGPLPAMDRAMAETTAGAGFARLIQQAGVRTTPGAILLWSLALAVLIGAATALFARQVYLPLVTAPIGLALPTMWLRHKRTSRLKRFEEQFPEALDLLSRAIRAGHAFQTALGMAAEELPEPVGPEFKKTFEEQNFGLPLRDALNALAERVAILDVRFFVTAVLIQRESGGNLSEILDNLAHVVRERFKIRRQVRVHTAHGRFTGYVLLALPAALAVTLSFINPEHMELLFREHMGKMMLAAAVVMQSIGFVWIRQVIKIEV